MEKRPGASCWTSCWKHFDPTARNDRLQPYTTLAKARCTAIESFFRRRPGRVPFLGTRPPSRRALHSAACKRSLTATLESSLLQPLQQARTIPLVFFMMWNKCLVGSSGRPMVPEKKAKMQFSRTKDKFREIYWSPSI